MTDINPQDTHEHNTSWPIIDGSYIVGNPIAPVAVCTLTSEELLKPLAVMPGVAIAGEVQTANLGIERIILNVTTNPSIRFLLLCGKESRLFRPGQSLAALVENGVDQDGRIVDAQGYEPILRNLPRTQIDAFRNQVELVDWTGEKDIEVLRERIGNLAARNPGRFEARWDSDNATKPQDSEQGRFTPIRPGGQREPLIYDPKGYFVITIDRSVGQIVLRHYLPDHTPAHEMRGRSAESMSLGLLREGLVSQLSHAAYLGGELAKAESALRLGVSVRYEQDRPLRRDSAPPSSSQESGAAEAPAPAMPTVAASLTKEQLLSKHVGETVDIVVEVTAQPSEHLLEGTLVEPGQDDPLRSFRRTDHTLRIRWSPDTQVVMGNPKHFTPPALLRVHATQQSENDMDAQLIAVLTHVASIVPTPDSPNPP